MITKNIPQKLSRGALYYQLVVSSIIWVLIAIVAGIFLPMYAPWVNPFVLVLATIVIIGIPTCLYSFFYWKLFEYTISESSIVIKSGVIIRDEKTVNFNDIQNAQASYGPITALLGVKRVKAFTASPGQVQIVATGQGTSSTTITPDVDIILSKDDAEELLKIIKQGDVQKVAITPL